MHPVMAADEYFSKHLRGSSWFGATRHIKESALNQAQDQLTPYRGRTNFPRFLTAVFEQALWLIVSEGSSRVQMQQEGVTSFTLGNFSEQYDTKGRPSFISPSAWSYLERTGVKVGRLK